MRKCYYVIVQTDTGHLFPATGRGSTHAEFSAKAIPRLFPSRAAAESCLRWWLKGVTICHREGGGQWDEYDEWLETCPRPGRRKEDYEIREVRLSTRGRTLEGAR
jgi:hypothetical protein